MTVKEGAIMKIRISLLAILLIFLFGCQTLRKAKVDEPLDPNDPAFSSYAAGMKRSQGIVTIASLPTIPCESVTVM